MKKFLVIGNPIEHSLSPNLHNYWIKKNNLNAIYGKLETYENDLPELCKSVKRGELDGLNVTVPFKNSIIPFLDKLTTEAEKTQSVNTIYLKDEMVIGHNTDIEGFELAIKHIKYDVSQKKVLLLGAGGVSPSIIFALNNMKAKRIFISNRTRSKAENLKKIFSEIEIVEWGALPDLDMIINATSLGLKNDEKINLEYSKIGSNKLFYDVIYNPSQTNFLKYGKDTGNKTENGMKMFLYQAQASFKIWNKITPEVNDKILKLLD